MHPARRRGPHVLAAQRGELTMRRHTGVTLIELLVVMVIVAILASIAVPTYRNYVLRAQRTDATRGLLAIQGAEEKYFLQNSVYTDNLTGPPPGGLGMPSASENGLYLSLIHI